MPDVSVNRFGAAKGLIMSDVTQTNVNLSSLLSWISQNNNIDLRDFKAATNVVLGTLPNKIRGIDISGLPSLTSLSITSSDSNSRPYLRIRDCISLSSFGSGSAGYFRSVDASGCTSLTTLTAVIKWQAGDPYPIAFAGCNALTNLDFYGGVGASDFGAITMDFSALPALRYINSRTATGLVGFIAPPCSSNAYFSFYNCTSLLTADLSLATDLTNVSFQQCSALTTITISPSITAITLDAALCYLSEACVNDLVAKGVASGLSSQTLHIGGGNNHALTGQGITDKATLQGRGWTVN